MKPPPDEDPDVTAAVEDAIDADDRTGYRMWRHRVRGGTVGQVVALNGDVTRRSIALKMTADEYAVVVGAARERGLTPVSYVRQCVATSLVEEHGVDPSQIPWLMRDGLLP